VKRPGQLVETMNAVLKIIDDSSPDHGPRLEVYRDNQGDLYFSVVAADGKRSDTIRLCGPGGGSRHEGLALKLSRAFFPEPG